jgi:hypothetical protein
MILGKGVGISREFVDRQEFNVIAVFTFVFYIVDMTYQIMQSMMSYVLFIVYAVVFQYCVAGVIRTLRVLIVSYGIAA